MKSCCGDYSAGSTGVAPGAGVGMLSGTAAFYFASPRNSTILLFSHRLKQDPSVHATLPPEKKYGISLLQRDFEFNCSVPVHGLFCDRSSNFKNLHL
jgi:hypothetical protein